MCAFLCNALTVLAKNSGCEVHIVKNAAHSRFNLRRLPFRVPAVIWNLAGLYIHIIHSVFAVSHCQSLPLPI